MQSMWQTANTLLNERSASKRSLPNVLAINNRRNAINQSLAFNLVTEIAACGPGYVQFINGSWKMPKLLLLYTRRSSLLPPFHSSSSKNSSVPCYYLGIILYIKNLDNTEFKARGAVCDLMWAYTFLSNCFRWCIELQVKWWCSKWTGFVGTGPTCWGKCSWWTNCPIQTF
jgi:hypothetical protein